MALPQTEMRNRQSVETGKLVRITQLVLDRLAEQAHLEAVGQEGTRMPPLSMEAPEEPGEAEAAAAILRLQTQVETEHQES